MAQTTASSSGTLEDVTNTGIYRGLDGSATTLRGTITNQGLLSLNATGNYTELRVDGAVTLQGGGTLLLADNANNIVLGREAANPYFCCAATHLEDWLTNAAGHTIQGGGQLGFGRIGLTNLGLIEATAATPLDIVPGPRAS